MKINFQEIKRSFQRMAEVESILKRNAKINNNNNTDNIINHEEYKILISIITV